MKPLFLSIEGLQSFQERQEIDFEKIGREGLFGIFGPTGSGKSTIIDAMTLALYGNIIRFKTNKDNETRDYFDSEAINKNSNEARVNFKFKVGDDIYRVERSYKIGKKKINKSAILFKIENGEEIKIAENYKEIYHEIKENILGLTLEDFTRSVVLPQGNFSQFLKLSGNDKRDMLERIFNLQKYGELLATKASNHKSSLEKELKYIDIRLSEIGFNKEELENKTKELELLKIENERLKKEAKEIKDTLLEMENIKNLEIKISNLNQEKIKLEKDLPYINELENKKNEYEKIKPVIEKLNKKNEYEEKIKSLNTEIENLNTRHKNGSGMIAIEEKNYSSLEKQEIYLEKEKKKYFVSQDEILMASSLYENAQKRNELENKIKIFDKKLIDLENEKMNNRKNIENLKNNIKNLEDESNNIEEIPQDKILSIQNEILKNENLLKDLAKKENEYKKMISEKEELNILITKKENNLKGLEILKRNYTDDRKKFLVYELEKNLSDGDTCPLCGGIYHKNHFSISDNISFNEEEFEALEKNITNLKNDLMLSNEKIKNIISITDDIKNEINIIPQIKNEINNLKNEIENFLEENKEKKVRLSFLEKKIKEQNSSLNNFEIKSAKIEIEINNINSSLKEANDNLSKIEKSEFSLTELKENFETLKENSKKYFELDNELNSTRESKKYIYDKKIVPWTDKIKEFENDINTKTGERKSLILEFSNLASEINSVLPENKVCSHEYIEEIKNSINKIDEIKKEIEDYKNRSIYTLNTILEYKNQLGNRSFSKEKFENLSESDKMINRDLEQNIEESGKISNTIEHFNENRKKVENLLEEKEKIEIKLNPAKELFELLKGRKFLDFLSAGKLQSITRVASDTLQKITNGRYRINVDEKSDFSIIDNFNSAIRKPESLSGGETFMVSLCLALALANQIQLRGKSRLEFFFLDEGFGTLDSELLEIVFTVLENLRSEGMTVGIITHVEEIKNRVVRKLLVTPAQVGVSGTIVKEI